MFIRILFAAVIVASGSSSQAAVVKAEFTGIITSVDEYGTVPLFNFDPQSLVGQAYTAEFFYDTQLGSRLTSFASDALSGFNGENPVTSALLTIGVASRQVTG